METAVKLPRSIRKAVRETPADNRAYLQAWAHLDRLGAKLRMLWKTKKNTLQLLDEERRR